MIKAVIRRRMNEPQYIELFNDNQYLASAFGYGKASKTWNGYIIGISKIKEKEFPTDVFFHVDTIERRKE